MRIRCLTWSNASTVSNSMNPASSSAPAASVQPARVHASASAGSKHRARVVADEADGAAGEPRQAGHERRAELGHQAARDVDERFIGLGRDPRPIDHRAAASRAQHEERVLAEKRIARDLFAAFDRLEQERVVGVLGDLQKRRHRRQQVGHDLADHRHERAAPGQFDELFVGRLLHARTPVFHPAAASVASRNNPGGGGAPVHSSNCRSACAISISMPPIVQHPAARAWASSGVSAGA